MNSPRAIFFNVPGHGHVNPSLPLLKELSRRGHQVEYFITPGFREKVEASGAATQLYPPSLIGDVYFEDRGLNGSRPQRAAYELMKTTQAILPGLLSHARTTRPDYVLFDGMCPWGYWTARALDLPAVASLSLLPPIKPPLHALANKSFLRLLLGVLFRNPGDGFRAARLSKHLGEQYGVPPLGLPSILNATGDLSLAYTSAEFVPFSKTVNPSVRFVGRTLEEESHVDPALFDHVRGKPIIYISLGTLSNKNAGFYQQCIQAFTGCQAAVLMTTGNQFTSGDFGDLPDNIRVYPWLPQIAVLKRAALFITHGGLNSIHDGLYFGVPLLLCPQQEEQAFNASRAAELGAGLILNSDGWNAEDLRRQAEELLEDRRFQEKAQQIGETFRRAGGMKKAADEIEALLQRKGTLI